MKQRLIGKIYTEGEQKLVCLGSLNSNLYAMDIDTKEVESYSYTLASNLFGSSTDIMNVDSIIEEYYSKADKLMNGQVVTVNGESYCFVRRDGNAAILSERGKPENRLILDVFSIEPTDKIDENAAKYGLPLSRMALFNRIADEMKLEIACGVAYECEIRFKAFHIKRVGRMVEVEVYQHDFDANKKCIGVELEIEVYSEYHKELYAETGVYPIFASGKDLIPLNITSANNIFGESTTLTDDYGNRARILKVLKPLEEMNEVKIDLDFYSRSLSV